MSSFYEEIESNKRMTYVLFIAFFLLFLAIGWTASYLFDSFLILFLFVFIAIIYVSIAYYFSDKIVTAVSKAKLADGPKYAQLRNIVEEMSIAAGTPKPKVYIIEDSAINAFAAGRNPENSVVCVTTGCLSRLNRAELTGVIAHELSHIRNYDIRVMTIAAVLVGLSVLLSDLILRMFIWGGAGRNSGRRDGDQRIYLIAVVVAIALAILTPFIAQAIKFAISRQREYLADATGAKITRYPEGLASALEKIKNDSEVLESANKATAHMYIANPLKGQKLWLKNMFMTHPPIDERIAKLRAM